MVSSLSPPSYVLFAQNKGQWNNKVLYEGKFKGGKVFLEKQGLSYVFFPKDGLEEMHHNRHSNKAFTYHAVQMSFANCNQNASIHQSDSNLFYENYFIGKDPSKWASNVKSFKQIVYRNLYQGIDIKYCSEKNNFRFDFIVEANAHLDQLCLNFTGQNNLKIQEGNLVLATEVGDILQKAPYAYQIIDGKKQEVKCDYVLEKNSVKFKLGNNYNKNYELVIDPTLVFATYTGSLSDNFGMTATYDIQGNAYTAGMCFGPAYPLSPGAFQVNYMGGSGYGGDISISKFNPTGSNLLYSTYLGGTDVDSPESIIVNSLGELVVLGRSSSFDFPITTGAYQIANAGMSDLIVSKINQTGTSLLASTYIGGSQNDGINGFLNSSLLAYNYEDNLRGSVIVDDSNYVYIGGSTTSANFPVTSGCYQSVLKGTQDGCVLKLNPNLSNIVFSTYFGGDLSDGVYNIELDANNKIYVTGGTESNNFPTTAGSLHSNAMGGVVDGFVSLFSSNGNTLLASSYLGTGAYDQSYYIQLDKQNRVYVYGQTEGAYPVSAGVYSNPNSGQFIHCLSSNLSSSIFSTVVGSGDGFPDIVPSAFLVDVCGSIYLSGWGGTLYMQNQANSSTNNLPVTANAFMSTTDGNDFYFMVLDPNASSLQYATFFGGNLSHEHVDGGTSRFDKSGIIYQSICESCGGNDDMPSTPTAWSTQNGSSNCNNAVVKFTFNSNLTVAQLSTNPTNPVGCAPLSVSFSNHSINGINYFWNFGDGATSTAFQPTHTYTAVGVYTVQLISHNVNTCNVWDTTYTNVTVTSPAALTPIQYNISGCVPSVNVNFINNNSTTSNYVWSFGDGSSSTQIAPVHTYTSVGTYSVQLISTNTICNVIDTVNLSVNVTAPFVLAPIPDVNLCVGDSMRLNLSSPTGCTFTWTPSTYLTNPNVQRPYTTTPVDVTYHVAVEQSGCIAYDSVRVFVFKNDTKILLDPAHACIDDTVRLLANQNCTSYFWSNGESTPSINVVTPGFYYLTTIANNCLYKDSIRVDSFTHVSMNTYSISLCINESKQLLGPNGNYSYEWIPSYEMDHSDVFNPIVSPKYSLTYTLNIYNGPCLTSGNYDVVVYPLPTLTVTPKIVEVFSGEVVQMYCASDTICTWEPDYMLSCTFCNGSAAIVPSGITYYASIASEFGCVAKDSVVIKVTPTLYIPNSFSPNGDGINDVFKPEYTGYVEIELLIFDRWGENIFRTNDLDSGWNGTYKNVNCELGVYTYKLTATDINSNTIEKVGHVTLLR